MIDWKELNRFWRNEDGVAVAELAVVTPVFLLMFLSTIELGHMIKYSITVEKGLRSAVTYAGRVNNHDAVTIQKTKNIAMTGSPSGDEDYLVPGWAKAGATVTFEEKTYTQSISGGLDDVNSNIIAVTSDVPYVPVVGVLIPALEYLMSSQFRDGDLYITLTHEQANIGN